MFTITGTALFDPKEKSELAFRLLCWLGNRPEPSGPRLPTLLQ